MRPEQSREKPISLSRTILSIAEGGIDTIKQHPDYQKLEETAGTVQLGRSRKRWLNRNLTSYVQFLASNADLKDRLFAASPAFRDYITKSILERSLGPVFQRVLQGLETTDDPQILRFVSKNSSCLQKNDSFYFYLRRENPNKLPSFERTTNNILDVAFHSQDESPVRGFILQNFAEALSATDYIANSFYVYDKPPRYFPNRQYQRLQRLVSAVPPADYQWLAYYFQATTPDILPKNPVDKEVLAGRTDRAKIISTFWQTIHKGYGSDDNEMVFGRNDIARFWLEHFIKDDVSEQDLLTVAENFINLRSILIPLPKERGSEVARSSRGKIRIEYNHYVVSRLIADTQFSSNGRAISQLIAAGLPLTDNLINFLQHQGSPGLQHLEALKRETQRGKLDPHNPLQKDLEFLKFLSLGGIRYEDFEKLEFFNENDPIPSLDYMEQTEAETAAFEAANLYWFIQKRISSRRKLAVIGNERYGAYFVTDPLKSYLEELGVRISTCYVRSSGNTAAEIQKLAEAIKTYLVREEIDDLVIIDGTPNPFSNVTPRLPKSMQYYRDMFRGEKYRIAHWVPVPSDQIIIGNETPEPYNPPSLDKPQIILASPVIHPNHFSDLPLEFKNHRPGFFDDPERYARSGSKLVVTKKGIEKVIEGRTVEEMIMLVQTRITALMDKMIRITNPIFKEY